LVQHCTEKQGGAIRAGTGGEGELERGSGRGQGFRILLRQSSGDQASEHVAGGDAADPPVVLAEGGHSAESQGLGDNRGDVCNGQPGSREAQEGHARFVFE